MTAFDLPHQPTCAHCGKPLDNLPIPPAAEYGHPDYTVCSPRCDSEYRANLALLAMTWGQQSLTPGRPMREPVFSAFCRIRALWQAGRFAAYGILYGLIALAGLPAGAAPSLQERIEAIVAGHRAQVGVQIESADRSITAAIAPDKAFPMQSVYKLPIALAVLEKVDRGELSLTQPITVSRAELRPHTWSPLREKYPRGDTVRIPLDTIIRATISDSDNNGCDILLRLAGGPGQVTAWLRRHGFAHMTVATTERAMHGDWHIQYRNRTTPAEATCLLRRFHEKAFLKPRTHALLWSAMTASRLAPERLRSGLPRQTTLAHKTGTSLAFYRQQGMTLNDIGIAILPDGQPLFISVFVFRSKQPRAKTEKMIADIARAAWHDASARHTPAARAAARAPASP